MAQQGTVLSPPIPAYQNLPIQPDFYQPSRFVIENIALGQTTIITTTEDHNYVIGQNVRLLVPSVFGSYQLNETQGLVVSIPAADQVEVSINSSVGVSPFILSSSTYPSVAQILAIGDINNGNISNSGRVSNKTYILGSFINISPQ